MEKKELRIGNFVTDKWAKECIWPVVSLKKNKCLYGDFWCSYENLKQVSLTEDWLKRFGFEKDFDTPFLDDYEYVKVVREGNTETQIPAITITISKDFELYNGIYSQTVKSVHQLQNLYFALTGDELCIAD